MRCGHLAKKVLLGLIAEMTVATFVHSEGGEVNGKRSVEGSKRI
ncbi:hypothetical protein M670_00174 [Schinkia azotoformans MEV2011]|uniref:Uncharacterized protein n=1 Tax=Schinkia azotoformans MEV2011 TaxID=1348973 RepID=A0A072NTI1_SCHAZ|nr:hypothetical protein M670_00174 [Schinkia azotoformans MEV2011]